MKNINKNTLVALNSFTSTLIAFVATNSLNAVVIYSSFKFIDNIKSYSEVETLIMVAILFATAKINFSVSKYFKNKAKSNEKIKAVETVK